MSKDIYRRIGAIGGLSGGVLLMYLCGYWDVIPMAIFGGCGCVAGAITAEKVFQHQEEKNR